MHLKSAIQQLSLLKIGHTRLMEFPNISGDTKIYGKCEWENPFGSIKDRVALGMVVDCITRHPDLLNNNSPSGIIEYSGGNLAHALANICHRLNINLQVVLPDKTAANLIEKLTELNTIVHLTPAKKGFFGAIQRAKSIARQNQHLLLLYQHRNLNNLCCHKYHTAVEIYHQLQEKVVTNKLAFVASIGTGASLVGTYLGLKNYFANIILFATSPTEMPYGTKMIPHDKPKFSGSGGLGYGLKQYFVSPYEEMICKFYTFSIDECYQQMKDIYHQMGILIGSSAAANLLAAKHIASQYKGINAIVTILPSLATIEEARAYHAISQ